MRARVGEPLTAATVRIEAYSVLFGQMDSVLKDRKDRTYGNRL
jgi:hypothetical protein